MPVFKSQVARVKGQGGFATLPLVVIGAVIILAVGGALVLSGKFNSNPTSTPVPVADSSPAAESTSQPSAKASPKTTLTSKPESSANPKSNCNDKKDVCFNVDNPVVTIQEGYLDDANHWISRDLMLTGQGGGGYVVSLNGFPSVISERMPQQNFTNGGSQSIYLRAQKDVTKKGSYTGTISVKSLVTGVTTSTNLTINYVDWTSSAIHADPPQVTIDCKVIEDQYDKSKRQIDCGHYDEHVVKFYYFKNNKTIELRLKKAQASDPKSLNLSTQSVGAKTLYGGQDVYALSYYVEGFGNDVSNEPNATYTGQIQFVDQSTQQEVINVPYTIHIHAFGS